MSGSHVLSTFRVVHASCYGSVRCVTGCVAMRKLAKFWVAAVAAALGTMDANFDLRPARGQDARQIAYGRHLASECTACHRIGGVDNGIPSITGWRPADFVATMDFYRTGARPNQVMVSVVQSLDEAQIKALAAYYGSLPKPARK